MDNVTATGNTWTREIGQDGAFERTPTQFRSAVSADPSSTYPAEAGRYHLYVSLACPWAHRTLIARALKGLEDAISVDVVHPYLTDKGWSFATDFAGTTGDTVGSQAYLQQVYLQAAPDYAGLITVPVLWDKQQRSIVNNESADILRMLNTEFQSFSTRPELDLYPVALRSEIDAINAWVYPTINNGVYRSGFAQSQHAHEQAVDALFDALDRAERLLTSQNYLCGGVLTEADVRLFTTLIRFDAVYHTHFKCNRRLIGQYPALHRFTARLYRLPGVAATVDMAQIRFHYYFSHRHINPTGIVPKGPDVLAELAAIAV